MGQIIVGLAGLQRGIEANETGINTASFSCRYYPQDKPKIPDYRGLNIAWSIPDKLTRTVTLSGEVTGNTGVMAALFDTAQTFANDVADFAAHTGTSNAGGFYLDEATVNQTREGWRSVDQTYTSDPYIS